MKNIIISDLYYKYDDSSFKLGPLNEQIPLHKLVLFKGHNGSGKSTLGKILANDFKPIKGTIKNLPSKVFYYNQDTSNTTFENLKVKEHLQLIDSLKEKFVFAELIPLFNKYPDELSGGEKQLLGFNTMLGMEFDLIIFDELFNHLDFAVTKKILFYLKDELLKNNKSIIIIAHNIEQYLEFFDVIFEFKDGIIYNEK
ncbi:MAG: ATP-binding cassette domain-containing protein [Flavobacteriales bacterium]|nr:ATP-binding cassette domain-containing protein [Flavobacteriales bacterium]